MPNILQLLRQNETFAKLDENVLEEFSKTCSERLFKKDDILTAEMVQGDEIYFILEGEVTIGLELAEIGSTVEPLTETTGDLIGISHFIEEAVSNTTVIARSDVKALVWKASAWREICDRHPRAGYILAIAVAKTLMQRIRYFNMHIFASLPWGFE